MTPSQEAKLRKLGPFNLYQAEEIGISHQELSKLVKEDKIHRMERGIYLHPKAKITREIDFQIACTKFGPEAVVGGLTALYYYNLANQVPQQTWLLVPPKQRTSAKGYRLIRTKTPLEIGVVEGDGYRIVSIERAIAEGFKLASKIGERTAIKAARIAIQQRLTTLKKIGVMSRKLGLDSSLTKYFEALIGAIEG
ncbi:MAG: type IV toxin-antitoxin system AbiEi family antitoxin domain-containing protein [Proteobacteria bacterium]|nr:type IV toxin-antitoxin system AbiEi family antitoxin domain-containing protein [Pseudomonadota bacterium]